MPRNYRWREEFIARMIKAGATLESCRVILRKSATLQRLAEGQCNGDWPWDDGQRASVPCPACEAGTAPSALKYGAVRSFVGGGVTVASRVCPDCRTSAALTAYMAAEMPGWRVKFAGDPRGSVVQVYPPPADDMTIYGDDYKPVRCEHTPENRSSGRCSHGIGVPA